MDRYEPGNYIRRWGEFAQADGQPADPSVAICRVVGPNGQESVYTSRGSNVQWHGTGIYFWHMLAARLGCWHVRWSCGDGLVIAPQAADSFEIVKDIYGKDFPTLTDGNLTLVPLALEHLEMLRTWRNRDDVRRWFFSSEIISEANQRQWFYEKYLRDPGDFMWIAHLDGVPVGTGALAHVDLDKCEGEWARLMIGEDNARGKGVAHRIAALVRDYALDGLGLLRVYGSLYTANAVTMHVDMSAGYMPYKAEGDITHVQLLRKDWRK